MNGTKLAFGAVAVACAASLVASRSGSRSAVKWNLDSEYDHVSHIRKWFEETDFPKDEIEWWGIDDVYPDQKYLNESIVLDYERIFRRGKPVRAIYVEEDGRLRDGHHRLIAARRVGIDEIPVVVLVYDPYAWE